VKTAEVAPPASAIRRGRPADAAALTDLAFRSKAHWGYDASLLELWRPDLTFTPESIAEHETFVIDRAGAPIGVAAISYEDGVAELEALWVDPAAMGEGLGRRLFARAVEGARALGARQLVIASDPNAEGFYRRMGARGAGSVPAKPAGRRLPKLVFDL
jgi:GNAT superfamily N-acetyltransferase